MFLLPFLTLIDEEPCNATRLGKNINTWNHYASDMYNNRGERVIRFIKEKLMNRKTLKQYDIKPC